MKRSPLNRRGKRTREWEKIRRELKGRFQKAGITTCEICLPQCWRDYALSFAHPVKRRFITSEIGLKHCALACGACHTSIEGMTHEQMEHIVNQAIFSRPIQP